MALNDAQPPFNLSYQATAGADKIIKGQPGYLDGIVVGANVGSSVVEISNHATDGDGDVVFYLAGDTLLGYYPVKADFSVGISADLTNQTNVTFIYR